MDRELTHWLDLARVEARRRRHEGVEPEHFALVGLAKVRLSQALVQHGLDPAELRERLEGALTTRPTVGGYRDGDDAQLSPSLQRVVDRLEGPRWHPFRKPLSVHDSLLLEPSIAALVVELRRGNDYRHILERARALAVVHGHLVVSVAHVFHVLLDLRSFLDAILRAEGEVDRLRVALTETLGRNATQPVSRPPVLDPAMKAVVDAAELMARSFGPAPATIRQLCLQLAVARVCEPFWEAAGINASHFVRAVHLPEANRRTGLLR